MSSGIHSFPHPLKMVYINQQPASLVDDNAFYDCKGSKYILFTQIIWHIFCFALANLTIWVQVFPLVFPCSRQQPPRCQAPQGWYLP